MSHAPLACMPARDDRPSGQAKSSHSPGEEGNPRLALAKAALLGLANPGPGSAQAEQALRGLALLGEAQRLQRSLQDCIAGRATVVTGARAFLVSDRGPDARLAAAESVIDPLCDAASTWFGTRTPALLVDVRFNSADTSHCVHAVPGLGHIVLAGSCSLAEMPAALAHELAHCHFRCGNQFLDEGLAVHFETSHVPAHTFPAATDAMHTLLSDRARLTPLHALLRWQARPVAGGVASPIPVQQVYAQAWALVNHWWHTLGPARTLSACLAIASAPERLRDTVFRQATGQSIDDTHTAVFGAMPAPPSAEEPPADTDPDARAVRLQRQDQARTILGELLAIGPALRADPRLPARLAEVDALLAPDATARAASADALLLHAWRQTVGMLLPLGQAAAHEQLQAAIGAYDAALAAAPDDVQVLHAAGTFFLALPASVGGRPTFARHCLARAVAPAGQRADQIAINVTKVTHATNGTPT